MTQRTLNELVENFSLLDGWEERYRYLIELGRELPPMDDSLKTDETFVRGCTSQVWFVASRGADGRFHFIADSDAHIVRGLIKILLVAYENKTAEEIRGMDVEGAFLKIGLDQHLSPNRRNGFFAMVKRIGELTA